MQREDNKDTVTTVTGVDLANGRDETMLSIYEDGALVRTVGPVTMVAAKNREPGAGTPIVFREKMDLTEHNPHPIAAAFERGDHPTLPQPVPEVRHELAGVGEQVHYTRHIPRGATALDRDGRRFAVWPDGTHGYTRATRCAPGLSSHSFGPYTIERVGLTVAQCDEAVLG